MAFVDSFEPYVGHGIVSGGIIVFNQGEIGVLVLNEVALVVFWRCGWLIVPEASIWVAGCLKDDVVVLGDDCFILFKDSFTSIVTQFNSILIELNRMRGAQWQPRRCRKDP